MVLELKEPPPGPRGKLLHLVLEESIVLIVLELREHRPGPRGEHSFGSRKETLNILVLGKNTPWS